MKNELEKSAYKEVKEPELYEGNFSEGNVVHTGSTLLDLAIGGGRARGGGIPLGKVIEVYGVSGSGKTVLLSEIAGYAQSKGGSVLFMDPEARLDTGYCKLFNFMLDNKNVTYFNPDTVTEVFSSIPDWNPETGNMNVVCIDSLAALSTKLELDGEDKYGTRRAKEFSEWFRRICRIIKEKNYLVVCSNQVRTNIGAVNPYTPRDNTPGGRATEFYSSVRLHFKSVKKFKRTRAGQERTMGVEVKVQVIKNSVDKPFREAPVTIDFDYGIDDVRENLKWLKEIRKKTVYTMDAGKTSLSRSLDDSITVIEEGGLEDKLRQEVITTWNKVEDLFKVKRKPKRRY